MINNIEIRCENHLEEGEKITLGAFYDFVGLFQTLPNPQTRIPEEEQYHKDSPLYDIYYPAKQETYEGRPTDVIGSYADFVRVMTKEFPRFDPATFEKPSLRVQHSVTGEKHERITMHAFVDLMIAAPPTTFKYFFSPIGLL